MSNKDFNFDEPAELFAGGSWKGRPTAVTYRRFDTAAEAIRFTVEELVGAGARACVLEVNEKRFNSVEIRKLYDSSNFPLPRSTGEDTHAT